MNSDSYFPEVGVAVYARKLKIVSEALGLLDEARTKLAATENEQLNKIAEEVEQLALKF